MVMRTTIRIAATATALALFACSGDGGSVGFPSRSTDTSSPFFRAQSGGEATIADLVAFDSCDDALANIRAEASARVGPYGIPGVTPYGGGWIEDGQVLSDFDAAVGAPTAGGTGNTAAERSAAPAEQSGYSTTNVQEKGIDEPDVVKNDGERIVSVVGAKLRVIDVRDGNPVVVGTLTLPEDSWGHQLLVQGDRALVLATHQINDVMPMGGRMAYIPADSTLFSIDLSDPAAPKVTSTLTVDGTVLSARQIGQTARVVVSSMPTDHEFVYPTSVAGEERAEQLNRDVVEASTLEDWLPGFKLESAGEERSGTLISCDRLSHPGEFAGFSTVSVLTFDLTEDLDEGDGVGVMADGQTVYASAERLYVATNRWIDPGSPVPTEAIAPEPQPQDLTTGIHAFAISGEGPATYLASGEVRGHVLNQYAMSEHEGVLRVATTDGNDSSESFVTTFGQDGDRLAQLGQVGGLGKGEQIYAVRFIGSTGYVVTFRQTDPLYTIDLRDPARPAVVGELKIDGYSAYLHPAGEGRLIGIGQGATTEGRVVGTQLSLFDVSDPASPTRLQQLVLSGSSSDAEYDAHAFLWWDAADLVVAPLQVYEGERPFVGAIAARVTDGSIEQAGQIAHESGSGDPYDGRGMIQRSLVIDDSLYTISDLGVEVDALDTLVERSFLRF
jgi:uncharacterized secreted protein with C-terminal beta-propeller domain